MLQNQALKITFDFSVKKLLLLMAWSNSILLAYVEVVLTRMPFIYLIAKWIIPAIYTVLILLLLVRSTTRVVRRTDLIIFGATLLICIVHSFVFEHNHPSFNDNILDLVISILPFYFIGQMMIEELENGCFKEICIISQLTLIVCICYTILFGLNEDAAIRGDMGRSYDLLPHCCLIVYLAIKQKDIFNISLSAIGILYIALLGSRGALVILIIFCVFVIIFYSRVKHKITLMILIGLSGLVFLYSPLYMSSIVALRDVAEDIGLSTRIFDYILAGNITMDSNRSLIREQVIEFIKEKPFWGYGMYADRKLIGGYPHQLFLELCLHFGIVLGMVIFLCFSIPPIMALLKEKNKDVHALLFAIFCASYLKLMLFSDSYLYNELLFCLLGMCVAINRKYLHKERLIKGE